MPVTLPLCSRIAQRIAIVVLALLGCYPAQAQTCSIGNFTGSYGSVNVLTGAAVDSATTFSVSCTGLPLFTVRLCLEIGPGSNVDGSGQRLMASGANTVRHELYSNAGRTNIWGSWGSVITTYTPAPSGVSYDLGLNLLGGGSVTFTVYGRLLGSQTTAVPGSYSWSSTNSPGLRYGYVGASSCPTGSKTDTTSGTNWSATLDASCNVSSGNVGFGSVGALSANVDATGSVSVQCTNTTPYRISLNWGLGAGAGPLSRRMTGPSSNVVAYTIYRDAGRTQEWGNTLGTTTVDSTGTGSTQTHTGYARVAPQTTPPAGSYSDTIIATVNY